MVSQRCFTARSREKVREWAATRRPSPSLDHPLPLAFAHDSATQVQMASRAEISTVRPRVLTGCESTGSPHSATCSSSSTFRSHRFPLASRAVSFDCSAGHGAGRRREHREARQHRQPGLDRLDDRAPPAGGPAIRPVAYCARARHDCSRARTAHRLSFARQRRLEGLRSRQGPVHLLARGNLAGKGTRHRLEEIT